MITRITAMGDSITAAGWPQILGRAIGVDIRNRGHNGATTGDGVEDVRAVLAYDRPHVLLVSYGLNDVACRIPEDEILGNLQRIIRAARAEQAQPIVATLTPMFPPYDFLAQDARDVSQRIRTWASADRFEVADVEQAFDRERGLIGPDGIHPNPAGLRRIAEVFGALLRAHRPGPAPG